MRAWSGSGEWFDRLPHANPNNLNDKLDTCIFGVGWNNIGMNFPKSIAYAGKRQHDKFVIAKQITPHTHSSSQTLHAPLVSYLGRPV